MADTTTTLLGLIKPEDGASTNTWGAKLNTNFDLIDAKFVAVDTEFDTFDDALAAEILARQEANTVPGHIHGLHIANSTGDVTNDILIRPGTCASADATNRIVLPTAMTKKLDAAWSPGDGGGGLDTGTIADTSYHVYAIKNTASGAVDVIFSQSPSAPTLPSGYTKYRRIASFYRSASAIGLFLQHGDRFIYPVEITDRNNATAGVYTLTCSVPTGINVFPIMRMSMRQQATGALQAVGYLGDGLSGATRRPVMTCTLNGEVLISHFDGGFVTNTSAQLQFELSATTLFTLVIQTQGYIDRRGQDV